jgi:hypothetical protein
MLKAIFSTVLLIGVGTCVYEATANLWLTIAAQLTLLYIRLD